MQKDLVEAPTHLGSAVDWVIVSSDGLRIGVVGPVARVARANEHVAAVCVRRPLLLAIRSTTVRPTDDSVRRDNLLADAVRDGDGTDGVLDLNRRRVCPEPDDSREPGRDGLASLLDDSSSYDLRGAECEP